MSDIRAEVDTTVLVVLTTLPDAGSAEALAVQLLEERLVACANVLPGAQSVYRWKGEIRSDQEAVVILKTTHASLRELERRLPELHPYEVPEVIALDVVGGLDRYLSWVRAETGGAA